MVKMVKMVSVLTTSHRADSLQRQRASFYAGERVYEP